MANRLPLSDFRAVSTYEKSYSDHRTGRKCAVAGCNGALHDTIINFGEDLPEQAFKLAAANAKKADLCLVLGSSCRVTPANSIPETVGRSKKAKLVICNLQSTPLDDVADKKRGEGDARDGKMGINSQDESQDDGKRENGLDVDDSSKDATLVGDAERRRKSIVPGNTDGTIGNE